MRHSILIPDAHAMGSLASIRSLGRAGHRIIASSAQPDAIGLASNFVDVGLSQPSYEDIECFLDWLATTIKREAIDLIIPTEGFLLAIRPRFDKFCPLLPIPQNAENVYQAFSKFDLFKTFLGSDSPPALRENLPPTLLIDQASVSLASSTECGGPFYLKADACYGLPESDSLVVRLEELDSVRKSISENIKKYSRFIVQGHASGQGVGVFFLRWKGSIRAKFMHRRLHEVPIEGGVSSLRESWWHEEIYLDALARVNYLNWDGVSMFEYKWDSETGKFYLLEMNARFWGSLHLPIYAGVDFPKLLVAARDNELFPMPQFATNVRCRNTFPKEIEYVISCIKSNKLSKIAKIWSVIEFFYLSANPAIKSDMLFPGDRKLYFYSILSTIKKIIG